MQCGSNLIASQYTAHAHFVPGLGWNVHNICCPWPALFLTLWKFNQTWYDQNFLGKQLWLWLLEPCWKPFKEIDINCVCVPNLAAIKRLWSGVHITFLDWFQRSTWRWCLVHTLYGQHLTYKLLSSLSSWLLSSLSSLEHGRW